MLLSLGCHLQWYPYLLGQTWHAFRPSNWERSTCVRVINTSGQPDQSKDCGDLTGPSSKKLWVSFSYTTAHGMSSHEGSGASTCQSWDLHDQEKIGLSFKTDSLCPAHLLLTGDAIRVALCTGEPLAAMTTGHQKSGYCRAEHANPRRLALQWPTVENQSPRTPDCWYKHYTVAMPTLQICTQNQGTQASKYTTLFLSVNCGRPTRPGTSAFVPSIYSMHGHKSFLRSKCFCSHWWGCQPLVTLPWCSHCTACC